MTVVVNVPHGASVSSARSDATPTLADLNRRADRVEKAIQILVEARGAMS